MSINNVAFTSYANKKLVVLFPSNTTFNLNTSLVSSSQTCTESIYSSAPPLNTSRTIHWLPWWLSGKESAWNAGDAGDVGLIPRPGRSPREGNGNPLQYSCLENPMKASLVGYSP